MQSEDGEHVSYRDEACNWARDEAATVQAMDRAKQLCNCQSAKGECAS